MHQKNWQSFELAVFLWLMQKVNKEITELQAELDMLKEKNKQAEVNLLMMHSLSREKVRRLHSITYDFKESIF